MRCPVYATLPTREMGRWAVEEWVEARSAAEKNEARDVVVAEGSGAAGKKRKGKGKEAVRDADAMVKEEGKEEEGDESKDAWDAVWKVSTKEIRDAFLAVNAIRWTQPVHLSGPFEASHTP